MNPWSQARCSHRCDLFSGFFISLMPINSGKFTGSTVKKSENLALGRLTRICRIALRFKQKFLRTYTTTLRTPEDHQSSAAELRQ